MSPCLGSCLCGGGGCRSVGAVNSAVVVLTLTSSLFTSGNGRLGLTSPSKARRVMFCRGRISPTMGRLYCQMSCGSRPMIGRSHTKLRLSGQV